MILTQDTDLDMSRVTGKRKALRKKKDLVRGEALGFPAKSDVQVRSRALPDKRLRRALRENRYLRDLDESVRKAYSVRLAVVLLNSDGMVEIPVCDESIHPPSICSLVSGMTKYKHSCAACKTSMLMAALARGMTKYTCFAGVSVLTVLSGILDSQPRMFVAASSCHFRHGVATGGKQPWEVLAIGTGAARKERARLRQYYSSLPLIHQADLDELGRTVAVAATEVGRIIDKLLKSNDEDLAASSDGSRKVSVFLVGPDVISSDSAAPIGAAIIPIIRALVSEWPQLAYSIKEIAAVARITPNYFSSLFHKQTGMKFSEYLAQCRLDHVQRLLLDTEHNIHEVGAASGFSDDVYFHRWFKAQTGYTPREWRARRRIAGAT